MKFVFKSNKLKPIASRNVVFFEDTPNVNRREIIEESIIGLPHTSTREIGILVEAPTRKAPELEQLPQNKQISYPENHGNSEEENE